MLFLWPFLRLILVALLSLSIIILRKLSLSMISINWLSIFGSPLTKFLKSGVILLLMPITSLVMLALKLFLHLFFIHFCIMLVFYILILISLSILMFFILLGLVGRLFTIEFFEWI